MPNLLHWLYRSVHQLLCPTVLSADGSDLLDAVPVERWCYSNLAFTDIFAPRTVGEDAIMVFLLHDYYGLRNFWYHPARPLQAAPIQCELYVSHMSLPYVPIMFLIQHLIDPDGL